MYEANPTRRHPVHRKCSNVDSLGYVRHPAAEMKRWLPTVMFWAAMVGAMWFVAVYDQSRPLVASVVTRTP